MSTHVKPHFGTALFRGLVALMLIVIVASACSSESVEPTTDPSAPAEEQPAEPPVVEPEPSLSGGEIWSLIEPALLALLDPATNQDPTTWRNATDVVRTVSNQASTQEMAETLLALAAVTDSGAEFAEERGGSSSLADGLMYLEIEELLDEAVSDFQNACVASGSTERECGLGGSDVAPMSNATEECRNPPLADFVYIDEQPAVACDGPHLARVLGRQQSLALDLLPPKGVLPDALREPYIEMMARDYAWCGDLASDLVPDIHSTTYRYQLMYEESDGGEILARCDLLRFEINYETQTDSFTDFGTFPPAQGDVQRICFSMNSSNDGYVSEDCATAEFEFRNSTRLNPNGDTPYPGKDAVRDLGRAACPDIFSVSTDRIAWAEGGVVVCRYKTG